MTISGQVVDQEGRGIPNINVSLVGPSLEAGDAATTSSFGYYSFDNVEPGSNYSLSITTRTFSFTSINLFVTNDLTDVIFVAE